MGSKEFDRRSFVITSGILIGGALLLVKSRKEIVGTGARIEPNTQRRLRHFTFANLMKDYPVGIDGSILEREARIHNVPLGNSQNTLVSLLPSIRLPAGGTVDIPTPFDRKMKLRIAGGAIEQVVQTLTGSNPDDWREQQFMSAALSDHLFAGLAHRGFILGHYSEGRARNKSDAYLQKILSCSNPPLIAHMFVKTKSNLYI